MVDIYIKNYTMEKHFLISESEKSRILNLHKNLLNEHGTMMEAPTGVDLVTPEKQINTIFNMSNAADLNKIKVVDGSGKPLPIDGFSKKDAAKGWMYLRSTKKPQVFDIKDSKGMKMSVDGKVLKAIPNKNGEVLTCRAAGREGNNRGPIVGGFCFSRFEIPLGNVQPSDIKNSYKKLVANVRFDASKWSDDANAQINGKA